MAFVETLQEPVICSETRVDIWGEWQIFMTGPRANMELPGRYAW